MQAMRPLVVAVILLIALTVCLSFPAPARAQLTHANSVDPLAGQAFASDPDAAIERARRLVASGELVAALRALAVYVSAHPKEAAPARYLGDLYYRNGDLGTAERTYLDILRTVGTDPETHDRLGGLYAAQDRVAAAIAQFQQSLPESSAYGHLVELHRRLGDLDRFERDYRIAAEIEPNHADAQYALGTVLRAERRPAEALTYLARALALDDRSCPTLTELGSAYLDLNRAPQAQAFLERCLAIDPQNYAALVDLGDVLVERNQLEPARAAFGHAHRVRPMGAEALVDLGYLEDIDAHWNEAVALYLRAIEADPLARDAYVNLGYDYDQHRLFALAEAAFLKGLSISPNDGRLHYLLGMAYADQGKRDLARAEYRRATTSDEPEVAQAASRDLSALP